MGKKEILYLGFWSLCFELVFPFQSQSEFCHQLSPGSIIYCLVQASGTYLMIYSTSFLAFKALPAHISINPTALHLSFSVIF